ncbi:hypothetical protein B484DRAFT_425305, partial [Ochromonadaceae sp. CCMP2298]
MCLGVVPEAAVTVEGQSLAQVPGWEGVVQGQSQAPGDTAVPLGQSTWETVRQAAAKDDRILRNQIVAVAVPALAACVVEPALTIVDMWFVGNTQNVARATAGLAGLSVTGAIFNIIAAFTYALCSGTTAVIARQRSPPVQNVQVLSPEGYQIDGESESGDGSAEGVGKQMQETGVGTQMQGVSQGTQMQELAQERQLGSVLVNGVVLALSLGGAFSLLLHLRGFSILSTFFPMDAGVMGMTADYLRLRGYSLPFTLISYVVIGFCLAVQDVKTPLLSILLSSAANIMGDYVLVFRQDGGLVGREPGNLEPVCLLYVYCILPPLPLYTTNFLSLYPPLYPPLSPSIPLYPPLTPSYPLY